VGYTDKEDADGAGVEWTISGKSCAILLMVGSELPIAEGNWDHVVIMDGLVMAVANPKVM